LRYEQTFPKSAGYLVADSVRAINPDSYYPGSPQRYYFRYNYNWFDKLRIGFSGEKIRVSKFFRGAQPAGMDFYAAFLCISNIGILKKPDDREFQGLIRAGTDPGFRPCHRFCPRIFNEYCQGQWNPSKPGYQ